MQEAAMTARQKKAIAAIEKDKKLSDSEKFKKIDAVMNEEEQIDEFHAPGMAPKPRKKPAPSSTKKSLGDISKRANEEAYCEKCGKVHEGSCMKEESELEEGMYVVRYKGADKTSDSAPMSKAAAEARAKRGNAADKVGGKYTVVPVSAKGHDVKEAYNEPQGQAKRMMSPLQKARMDKEKADRDRDGKLKPRMKKEELELEEDMMAAGKELEAYARKNGGIDKNDFMKAAVMMKKGQKKQLMKFVDELDTEPREKILSVISQNEEVEMNEDVDSLAKDFEARLKKQGYSSRTQDRERMATLAKAKKQGMNAMQMKQLDGKMNAIMNKMDEAAVVDTQATHSMDLLDTVNAILMGRRDELDEAKMDKVDKKALKKDYDDRKDKDIDNDGDEDDSDEYLHNKRKAVSKAIDKKDDAPKKRAKKPESQAEPVDVEPTLGESEMSDSEEKKREEIVMKLKSKKDEFKKKYGDRWEKVMYATATKMAMKK